ncbi:MAG: DUF2961 domain-containing protein [Bryobacterales bacterium]|nr:DUF2961 domain-containing protein [Bryobacterales bacterium]
MIRLCLAFLVCPLFLGLAQSPRQSPVGLDLAMPRDYVALRASSNNANRASNDDCKRPVPGETVVLADLEGPGVISHIWLTIAAKEYGWPRLLRLRVYYDGSSTPSIDAPVGDFFGAGLGQERNVNSLMVRNSSSGRSRNSYWPMPFRKSVRITVTNEGRLRVPNLYYHVDWRKVKQLPPDILYLHAWYRQELPTKLGKHYEILNVQGKGTYVGTVFSVVQNQPGWFGEGDEYFYVDGAAEPGIEGTGTEDYFNDAWTFRVSEGLYTGVTIAEGTGLGARMSAYRWHVQDPVPFTKSLRLEIEHAGWTYNTDGSVRSGFEEREDLFSSVAFWYQQGIATGLEEPPFGPLRLPHGNARQIEVEKAITQARAEGGRIEVQKEVFWGRDLLFFAAEGPGSKLHIPFEVSEEGDYEILAQIAHSSDYGTYEVLLDGKPLVSDVALEHEPGANLGGAGSLDAYYTEIYVAEDHMLGWKKLSQGPHVLTLVCTGKNQASSGYNIGVDTLILSRLGKREQAGGTRASAMRSSSDARELQAALRDEDAWVRWAAAWNLTQRPNAAAESAAHLAVSLRDPDPLVRGLAAVALANCACARTVLHPLIEALGDPDVNVRQRAADAIATAGEAAASAVPALIKAAMSADEEVQAQRSLANALGAIGPAAGAAIPALERMRENPRGRPEAESAIARIRGER